MTTENLETPEVERVFPEVDWFLRSLVVAANGGIEMSITLQVAGGMVSGMLISGATYFKGVAASMRGGTTSDALAPYFDMVEDAAKIYDQPAVDEEETTAPPAYIHLRDARYVDPAGHSTSPRDVWWRGRLSEVAGFSLGTFGS